MTAFFPIPTAVLNRENITFFETFCQQTVQNALSVRKLDVVEVLLTFRNDGKLPSLIQLCEIDIGPTHNAHDCFSFDLFSYFIEASNGKSPGRLTDQSHRIQLYDFLSHLPLRNFYKPIHTGPANFIRQLSHLSNGGSVTELTILGGSDHFSILDGV